MTTLREELERLADEPWPHGGPRYGRTELALAAANLALEAAAREADRVAVRSIALRDEYSNGRYIGADECAAAIRAMRVG